VIRLMTQHDDRNRMGEAARRSSSRFSAEAFAARLEALLSDSGVTRGALSKVEGC
jgi:glycosyltransferase involved in cell wall biosynthesis